MTISEHIGYVIGYIILLTMSVLFAANFASVEGKFLVKMDNAENSVVADRIVKCFSRDGDFGVVDTSKFNDKNGNEVLRKCMGEKYAFSIKLGMEGNSVLIEGGKLGQTRLVNRYVVVDGKPGKLEVSYSKNGL